MTNGNYLVNFISLHFHCLYERKHCRIFSYYYHLLCKVPLKSTLDLMSFPSSNNQNRRFFTLKDTLWPWSHHQVQTFLHDTFNTHTEIVFWLRTVLLLALILCPFHYLHEQEHCWIFYVLLSYWNPFFVSKMSHFLCNFGLHRSFSLPI